MKKGGCCKAIATKIRLTFKMLSTHIYSVNPMLVTTVLNFNSCTLLLRGVVSNFIDKINHDALNSEVIGN